MFNIFNIIFITFIIINIICLFYVKENFTEVESEDIYAESEEKINEEDIDEKKNSKSFFKIKPIDPINAIWDHQIDYCLNRGGTINDIDLKETLLNYKPKIILF